jgi:hypothetical protein
MLCDGLPGRLAMVATALATRAFAEEEDEAAATRLLARLNTDIAHVP